ncbi:MAG: L-histidine N(alpha)-methyltransferase [Candidatus Diapherotrites archaeon]
MKLQKLDRNKCPVVTLLDDALLEKRLSEALCRKKVCSEQWYREPEKWYSLTSFNNPYITIHSEFLLLEKNRVRLSEFAGKSTLVFYGVGTGDTESLFVKWMLENSKHAEVIAVDATRTYIERFAMISLNLENMVAGSEVSFLGLHALFEGLKRDMLHPENSKYKKRVHICLGNTTGNFEQGEIFGIFGRLAEKGEYLILGAHLSHDLEKTLRSYDTPLVSNFVFSSIKHKFSDKGIGDIEWKINKKENSIEAWLGDVNIFRSKKYTLDEIRALAKSSGFEFIEEYNDGNSAIVVLRKK